jgi:IclR family pca regulon transcriptional regulator
MTDSTDHYFSTTLEKGLLILSLFDLDHTSWRLSEISRHTGINKTSTYRFVNTLVRLGYLRKSEENSLLRLGPRAFVTGHNFYLGFDIRHSIKPIIEKTFLEHDISIDSALLYERSLISLCRFEVPTLRFLRLPLVMREPHARAMGKAVLANLSPDEQAAWIEDLTFQALTPHTIMDKEGLLEELEESRERGYSINDEEYVKGLICIGAPVFNYKTNRVRGAVSLDFPASQFKLEAIEANYAGVLTRVAGEVSERFTIAEV